MITLAQLSQEIALLAPIPVSLPRLAHVMSQPQSDLSEIVSIIEFDPALTANALKLANSAFFGSGVPIHSVREAVMRLGAGRILQQAVGSEVRGRLVQACPAYGLEERELWRHSVAAACAADQVIKYAKTRVHPVAFTAALLHDIGKLLITRHLDEAARERIVGFAAREQISFVEAERRILGFDHAQVGGVMARRWNFPDILVEAIARHHSPSHEQSENTALHAVHISNVVAKMIGIGLGLEQMNMTADAYSAQVLGLSSTALEAVCVGAHGDLPHVISLFEEDANVVQCTDR
jgi:putative nucleotidyltransferase with HDIG domain